MVIVGLKWSVLVDIDGQLLVNIDGQLLVISCLVMVNNGFIATMHEGG